MTVPEIVIDQLRTLSAEDQQMVLEFVQALRRSRDPSEPFAGDRSQQAARETLQGAEWAQKNARRFELIQKKNRQGLPPKELAEFEQLQAEAFELLRLAFPPPPLDTERLDRFEQRLASTTEASQPS
jgi:hypothetical protein